MYFVRFSVVLFIILFKQSRQEEECILTIKDCDPTGDVFVQKSKIHPIEMLAIYPNHCKYHDFIWIIADGKKTISENHASINPFIIKPYTLRTGEHGVNMMATVDGKKDFAMCALEIKPEIPIPTIKGGSERVVTSSQSFKLDGSQSINLDRSEKMSFSWKCTVVKGEIKNLCDKFTDNKRPIITVSSSWAKNGYKFLFTLGVTISKVTEQTTTQLVTIQENAVEIEIICEKNCPPVSPNTDPGQITFLRAVCVKNCQNLHPESSYEWTIDSQGFSYDKDTQYGRTNEKFVINSDVLKSDAKIDLKLKNSIGGGTKLLKIDKPAKIDSCDVIPPVGQALETSFEIDCKITGDPERFEIYSSKNDRKVLVKSASILSSMNVRLPSDEEIFLKVISKFNSETEIKLRVDVRPTEFNDDTIPKLLNSVDEFIDNKNFDSAIQIMNGMIESLGEDDPNSNRSVRDVMKMELLEKLGNLPMDDIQSSIRVASLVNKIVQKTGKESDPELGHLAARTCKKAASNQLAFMKKENFPKSLSKVMVASTKILVGCAEVNTLPNAKALIPPDDILKVTTSFPLLDGESVVREDYPDYDDVSVGRKRSNFEKSSTDLTETCSFSTKAMALTMAEGEKTVESVTRFCTTSSTKLSGRNLAKTLIKSDKITISPSQDFESLAKTIEVLVCSWSKDPFWWNFKGENVTSNVFMIEFSESGSDRKIDRFTKPVRINVEIYKNNNNSETHDIPLSMIKYKEPEISAVVRVDVLKNQSFFVEFLDLAANDHLNVILTDFRRPKREDLVKPTVVSAKNSIIHQHHNHDYDGFHYVTILRPDHIGNVSLSVYTLSCKSWNSTKKEWQFACRSASDSIKTMVVCECYHLSVLSASITYNGVVIDTETLSPDFTMPLISCPTIFTATCIIFGLYCLLSLLTIRKIRSESKDCYFLGDCLCSARFCYIISVRTGKKRSAGTTSNVCIRLFGTKAKSKPHVLNYPDPKLRFLQKSNEDWFMLAELRHLGNIEEIALWFDCSGRSSSWYCKDVTIYDVQTLDKWNFRVKTWFRLLPNGESVIKVRPWCKKTKIKWKIMEKTLESWENVSIRSQNESKFSFFRRLTIVLSIILSTYVVNLLAFGLPELKHRDGFYNLQFTWIIPTILIMGIGTNFVYHKILSLLFQHADEKLSKKHYSTVCWLILTAGLVITMTILLVFGFWINEMTSYYWLVSTLASLLLYVIILEGTYTFMLTFCVRTKPKFGDTKDVIIRKLSDILKSVERQRSFLCKQFGSAMLRPYMKHLYHPLSESEIKSKKYKLETNLQISELLEDTIMFVMYITLLYLVILADRDSSTIQAHVEMKKLVSGLHTRSFKLDGMKSLDDFYKYLEDTLIPAMQSPTWYGRFVLKDAGLMADFQNKYIGVARLRQHRISRKAACTIPIEMRFLYNDSDKCRPEFSWGGDFKHYGTDEGRLAEIWNYTSMKIAGTNVLVEKFGFYPGGGFIAPLGRTIYNSYVNLDYLKTNRWLDDDTRAIFVEFLTYNVNSDLFNAIRVIVEKSATGYIRARLSVETVKLLFQNESSNKINLLIFAGFVMIVAIFTIKLLVRIVKKRQVFFKDLWHLIDIVIAGMSAASFAIYIERMELVGTFLEKVEQSKRNEFVKYFHLLRTNSTLSIMAAFLVCISTIRLWKLLRFGTIFRVLEKTLALCAIPILALLLYHIVIMMAFSLGAYIIFGSESYDFKNLPDTVVTLVILSLNLFETFNLNSITRNHSFLGYIFYSCFMVTTLLLYTVYVTIIVEYYGEAQILHSSIEKQQDLKEYVIGELKYFKNLSKIRIRGGQKVDECKVTPKADEHRYAGCKTITKNHLEIMRLLTVFELKKKIRVVREEEINETILKLIRLLPNRTNHTNDEEDDNDELFFKSGLGMRGVALIPDLRLSQMERIVEIMLNREKERMQMIQLRKDMTKYKEAVRRQTRKLEFIEESLKSISRILDRVEIIKD